MGIDGVLRQTQRQPSVAKQPCNVLQYNGNLCLGLKLLLFNINKEEAGTFVVRWDSWRQTHTCDSFPIST